MSENLQVEVSGHDSHSLALAHPDETRPGAVGLSIALLAIVLAVTSYMLWIYFEREAEAITHAVVLSKQSEALQKLRALERDELSGYAVIDRDAGVVRIPVEAGAALFVKEAQARSLRGEPQRIEGVAAPAEAGGEESIP
jgi:hypothetical protein